MPSRSSRLAPPPVEMWLILSARPTFSTVATESPPPIIVVTPLALRAASFLATAWKQDCSPISIDFQSCKSSRLLKGSYFKQCTSVPAANLSNSNTPMGPFLTMVWVLSKAALNALMLSGPMSKPIQPSGIAVAGTTWTKKSTLLVSARSHTTYKKKKKRERESGINGNGSAPRTQDPLVSCQGRCNSPPSQNLIFLH